jgi:hypothetical protein
MADRRISPDEARSIRRADMLGDRLVKLASTPTSWNASNRSARFTMTSQTVDRAGDIVVTNGVDTTEFLKSPMAFLNHASASWPIGLWTNVVKHLRAQVPRMEGDLVLHEASGPIPEVDQAAWMIERGYMKACSIGFLPDWSACERVLNASGAWSGGLIFHKTELLECSLCGVPANPQALAKGLHGNQQRAGNRSFDKAVAQRLRVLEVDAIRKRGTGHGSQ